MPDPQDTGAQQAAASNSETGTPPGGQGGGTADPTQIVQSTQQGQPADIHDYEEPFDPYAQGDDQSDWGFNDDQSDGDYNPEDEDSDPHQHTQGQGLQEQQPGPTECESFIQQFNTLLSAISLTNETVDIPDKIAELLNTTLPQINDE